jgi:hypothetical protein
MRLKPLPHASDCAVATKRAGLACAPEKPPFLTNDPGTPASGSWEVNIASVQTVTRYATYKLSSIDQNHALGDRHTYEEIDAELFDDRTHGGDNVHAVTWDIGGCCKLHRCFIRDRSLDSTSAGQPEFLVCLGVQVLQSHHGLALGGEAGGHP